MVLQIHHRISQIHLSKYRPTFPVGRETRFQKLGTTGSSPDLPHVHKCTIPVLIAADIHMFMFFTAKNLN